MRRSLSYVAGLSALVLGTALAHAELTRVVPTPGTAVTEPTAVTLQFSEPLNTRFSTFRVVAVPTGKTPQEAAKIALNVKGASLTWGTLPTTLPTTTSLIRLPLKPGLARGMYVVAWRILSDDSHPVTDFRTFRVR